jgi:hypothetical protein
MLGHPDGEKHDMSRLCLVPLAREEMVLDDLARRDACTDVAALRRVPVRSGAPADNQHGTELWKYMTQNTFRRS